MSKEIADNRYAVANPHNWDKVVAVAYLRLIGQSQSAAAKGVGVAVRSIRNWENSDFWPTACQEARSRWMQALDAKARAALIRSLDGDDGTLALKVLERIDNDLAPSRKTHDLNHSGEINNRQLSDDELAQRAAALAKKLQGGD